MINDKCIYCNKQNDFNGEHAFPESLLDKRLIGTVHEWIIDTHLCKKCNSHLGKLDATLTKKSPLAFIWDQIQNELGNTAQTLHSSIYRKAAAGINPLGLFYPDPHYDNLIVMHEVTSADIDASTPVSSATALRPQIVLIQYPKGESVDKVIAENCARFHINGLGEDQITSSDEHGEVHSIFGNTYIFTPKASEYFFRKISEFKAKFLTDFPHTQYYLRVITPEEGKYQGTVETFYNSLHSSEKEVIEGERFLNLEPIEHFIEVRADRKAMTDVRKSNRKSSISLFFV